MTSVAAHTNAPRPPRPESVVSSAVGLVGLAGLMIWIITARNLHVAYPALDVGGRWVALACALLGCGLPMTLWSVFVDKVHRNPTTGIDWDTPLKPLSATLELSLTKLAGLWATWAGLIALYCIGRWYWTGNYAFALETFRWGGLPLFLLSIPYVIQMDRYFIEPRDGAYALGVWLMGEGPADWDAINAHIRSWVVKGFFTAFMISIVPIGYRGVVEESWADITRSLVNLTNWLVEFMFVIDVCLATTGYLLTMRALDAHIRSATPYAAGWVSALICYPPFALMGHGLPLDYHVDTADWSVWLAGPWRDPTLEVLRVVLLTTDAVLLVLLTAIYAWATMAFGIRFSNLTDRGILTHGPYALTKHPAYLSKNLFWWLSTLPFLVTTHSLTDAVRNTALMACVSGVYYWRARTEEWHLRNDPAYGFYEQWMADHGLITARLRRLLGF